jgi:HupE / UreJ protein
LRSVRSLLFLAACLLWTAARTAAHDIPRDVTVHILVRPVDGSRLQMLVRMPLNTIRDLDFPEREGGYLDVEKLAPLLHDAAKVSIADFIEIFEGETRLPRPSIAATRVSLASDRSFESFEAAFRHVTGPGLSNSSNLVWNQVMLDVLLEYPIQSDRSRFSIRPGLEHLGERVVVVLRSVAPGGVVRAYEFTGDPGIVPLDPRWHQAALRFVKLGFLHILDGTDHLLFLLCLVIPLRRLRPLVLVVTAFTVAHSCTLLASAYGLAPDALWFPPLIEMLIAVSIVYLALANIVGANGSHRWMTAFGFGLVHGFGFSFALRETLQFAGSHLFTSLVSFNLGVELGQVVVLMLLVPMLAALFRLVVAERIGTIILSAFVAHTGWHWILERGAVLRRFPRPNLDTAFFAGATRWLLAGLMLGGVMWVASRLLRRARGGTRKGKEETAEARRGLV